MTSRLLVLPLAAVALASLIAVTGVDQSASAAPAPDDTGSVSSTGNELGGQLTITSITSAQYESSDAYLSGQCVNQQGLTLCHELTYDNSWQGEAVWTAVAAVGHADDVYVDADVTTMEGNTLDSTGHASGLGPWVKIQWVRPMHPGDTDGLTIPGEAKLDLQTVLTVPDVAGVTAFCTSGQEGDFEYPLSCTT